MGFFDNYKKVKKKQNIANQHDLKMIVPDLNLYRIFQKFNNGDIIDFRKMDSPDYDVQHKAYTEFIIMVCKMIRKSFEYNLDVNTNTRKSENASSCINPSEDQYTLMSNDKTINPTQTVLTVKFPYYLFSYFFKCNAVSDKQIMDFNSNYNSFSMQSLEKGFSKEWKFYYSFTEENTHFRLNNQLLAKKFRKNSVSLSDKKWLMKKEMLCSAYAFYNRCFKNFTKTAYGKNAKKLNFERKYFIPTMLEYNRDYLDNQLLQQNSLSLSVKKVLNELWNANDTSHKDFLYEINLLEENEEVLYKNMEIPVTEKKISSKNISSDIIMKCVSKVSKLNAFRTCTNYCRLRNLLCYVETFFSFTGLRSTASENADITEYFYFPKLLLDYYLDKENLLSGNDRRNYREWTDINLWNSFPGNRYAYSLFGNYYANKNYKQLCNTKLKPNDIATFTFHYDDPWNPQKENLEILEKLLKDNNLLYDSMDDFIKNSPDTPRKNLLMRRKKYNLKNKNLYNEIMLDTITIDVPYFEEFEQFNISALYDRFEFHR